MKVLLVEPSYKNKYPPMGLMKISTYHKNNGDTVRFVKGICADEEEWDRIYITTLFTFHFKITAETISLYIQKYGKQKVFVGGIMSSLLTDRLIEATGIDRSHVLTGLFTDTSVVGDNNDINIDELPLDYDMLEDIDYKYPAGEHYISYTTRGCPNRCSFCAVPKLEPEFKITNNILNQIEYIDSKFGPKKDLLLLDNNVLNASIPELTKIVDDLCAAGFGKDAPTIIPSDFDIIMSRYRRGDRAAFLDKKMLDILNKAAPEWSYNSQNKDISFADYMLEHEESIRTMLGNNIRPKKTQRHVDFNQGVDARRITEENMAILSRLAIKPIRIAFDSLSLKEPYCNAVRLSHKYGIKTFSNYILFNYKDKPEDLYERLKINIELNQELGTSIYSFPMKYAPVMETDRTYVGEHWNKHALSNIAAILNVTRGIVAAGSGFFYKAFGNNITEFQELLDMPRDMVMYRFKYEELGITDEWRKLYRNLTEDQKKKLKETISRTVTEMKAYPWDKELENIKKYYVTKF